MNAVCKMLVILSLIISQINSVNTDIVCSIFSYCQSDLDDSGDQ
jgi:hypothetical protein